MPPRRPRPRLRPIIFRRKSRLSALRGAEPIGALARLQRGLVVGWCVGLSALAAINLGAGGWHSAWGPVLLAWVIGQPLWLLVGFVWMALAQGRGHRARPAQVHAAPGWRVWLRAWWLECGVAPRTFAWRQPFRAQALPDHLPAPGSRGRRGVVLVHGYFCNRGLWNPWMARLRQRRVPHVAVNLEPLFGSLDDMTATVDDAVRRLVEATGLPPLVVAHSMGGLVVRAWLAAGGSPGTEGLHIAGLMTLGTPHQGTALAALGFSSNARQMRCGSPWLAALQQAEPAPRSGQVVCAYSDCDNIVFPAVRDPWPGTEPWCLPGVAHLGLLDHPKVFDRLLSALRQGHFGVPPGHGRAVISVGASAADGEPGQLSPQGQGLEPQERPCVGRPPQHQGQHPDHQGAAHQQPSRRHSGS